MLNEQERLALEQNQGIAPLAMARQAAIRGQFAAQRGGVAAQLAGVDYQQQSDRLGLAGATGATLLQTSGNADSAQRMNLITGTVSALRANRENAPQILNLHNAQIALLNQQLGRSHFLTGLETDTIDSNAGSIDLASRGFGSSASIRAISADMRARIQSVDPSLPKNLQDDRISAIKGEGRARLDAMGRYLRGVGGFASQEGAYVNFGVRATSELSRFESDYNADLNKRISALRADPNMAPAERGKQIAELRGRMISDDPDRRAMTDWKAARLDLDNLSNDGLTKAKAAEGDTNGFPPEALQLLTEIRNYTRDGGGIGQ
jgi:hypothetical protein